MHHIHYTRDFLEQIKLEKKSDLIRKKLEALSQVENYKNFKHIAKFKGDIIVLRIKAGNNARVILEDRKIDNHNVLFVRKYVSKAGYEYQWGGSLHPLLEKGKWVEENPLSEVDIDDFKTRVEENEIGSDIEKLNLPEKLENWLDEFKIKISFQIYEMEEWVQYSQDRIHGLSDYNITNFRVLIKNIFNNEHNDIYIETSIIDRENSIYKIINKEYQIGLIYHDLFLENTRIIVIEGGANINRQEEKWNSLLDNFAKGENNKFTSIEEISKNAFRAYPKWVVETKDDEFWSSIQRYDGSHNLSLLPEQVAFLNNIKFPTYINGQAGSGKSTMLYYLFANIILYKTIGEIEGDIIFLTENDNLIENSFKQVKKLLLSTPEFNVNLSNSTINDTQKYFCSFINYLIELIPEEDKEKYSVNKYIDFALFKDRYNSDFNSSSRITAEEAWLVLNTYVYGYFEDELVDTKDKYIDDETGIPTKFRILDQNKFEEILKVALPFYKRLLSEDYWTRTTLVRAIWKYYPNKLPKQFDVVFCDEAQDFNRIELKLIIRSSNYTNYNLTNKKQIPIVLAGDALQTVSPIGFSETRLHHMFYEELMQCGFVYDYRLATYNPRFNYRSNEPIVKIANIIQEFRKKCLKEEGTIEQNAKRNNKKLQNPFVHSKEWLQKEGNYSQFTDKFKYKSFIIPIDLHEEDNYKSTEPLIQDNFTDVKSSIDAKGAEYSQVVVYGFGDFFMKEFGILDWNNSYDDYSIKFFFNKLYVAITRAQNELIIIDSEVANQKFWHPLFNLNENIEQLVHYDSQSLNLIESSSPDDALKNAEIDKEQGIKTKNRARLTVAGNTFAIIGKIEEADFCEAQKEIIKGNWAVAGEILKESTKYIKESSRYLFNGGNLTTLKSLKDLRLNDKHELRIILLSFLDTLSIKSEDIDFIYQKSDKLRLLLVDIIWYKEFKEKLIQFIGTIENKEELRKLESIVLSFINDSDYDMYMLLGNLNFKLGFYLKAISYWDNYYTNYEGKEIDFDYVKAMIEVSRDKNDVVGIFYWQYRLVNCPKYISPKEKLSKELLKFYSENKAELENSELINLKKYLLVLSIYSNEIDIVFEYIKVFEHTKFNKIKIAKTYSGIIKLASKEDIAILLKERWAKLHFEGILIDVVNKEKALNELNSEFSKMEFPFSTSNYDWSFEEIEQIPLVVSKPNITEETIFRNVTIENFKKIKKLEVLNLGMYNLILGNNNTGKTTLLESLTFSVNPSRFFKNLIYATHQRLNQEFPRTKDVVNRIKSKGQSNPVNYILKDGRRFTSFSIRTPFEQELQDSDSNSFSNINNYLAVVNNSNKDKFISKSFDDLTANYSTSEFMTEISFVPFGKGFDSNIAEIFLNKFANNKELLEELIDNMRCFIPNIINISFVRDYGIDGISITEIYEEKEITYNLADNGEGANKLFRILLQMMVNRNGKILIDEIDAGIHYSNFLQFWKIIIQFAKKLNIQFFCTTHNEECIEYFNMALSELNDNSIKNEARIITLVQHYETKQIVAITRDYNSFSFTIDIEKEIRGEGYEKH